jgi:hypothetical protein
MNSKKVAMVLTFAAALMALSARPSSAQQQLPPDRTSPCPVTHDCRSVTHGMQTQSGAGKPEPAKNIACPPGTVQIPNTNRCKVVSTGQ